MKGTPIPCGRKLQFIVIDVENGHRSSTWTVKTGKSKDDVYLMEVVTGGGWKASHHNDAGIWRISMTREIAEKWDVERLDVDEWPRETPQNGWSEGVAVLIPAMYLRPSNEAIPKKIVQVPLKQGYRAMVVRLFFEEPDASYFETPYSFPIGSMARSNGGKVIVIGEPTTLEDSEIAKLQVLRASAQESVGNQPHPSGRLVGVARMDDHRVLIDMVN
jgi:hypothetical protein